MVKRRRKYDKEFKLMAVELMETDKSVPEIAEDLGVKKDLLYQWRRKFIQKGETGFSVNGKKNLTPQEAEKEILEALTINPNHSLSRMYYSLILFPLQRPNEAKMQADFAYKLDSLNPLIHSIYGLTRLMEGDCASCLSVLENVPDNFLAFNYSWMAAFQCGDLDKAFEADKHQLSQIPLFNEGIMDKIEKIYHEKGFNAAYTEITKQLEIIAKKEYFAPDEMAFRYYMINQDDKAIDWFEKGAEFHEPGILLTSSIYKFTRLYDNPRFIAVLKKMNLPVD